MEKKLYISPVIDVVECEAEEELLAVSSEDYGIGYGGVDDGSLEPSSREYEF
ncbi:MAG: hypothetical protein IJU11_03580 [Prevotella sp.]|nr:hypothetical protein [Prevotella sp.]